MERDLPSLLRERAEDMRSWRTPVAADRAKLIDDAAAEIEVLRAALARVEGERDLLDTKRFNATYETLAVMIERDAALADCRILLAECEAIRADFAECGATASERWRAAMAATDASGARTRHATKGGGA